MVGYGVLRARNSEGRRMEIYSISSFEFVFGAIEVMM